MSDSSQDFMNTPDIQSETDSRGIVIQQVGISQLRYPLVWMEDQQMHSEGVFKFTASLPADQRGTHMSRFVELLHAQHTSLSMQTWMNFPDMIMEALQTDSASAEMQFSLFREIAAPVTGKIALQAAEVLLRSKKELSGNSSFSSMFIQLDIPIATVCPCSREISARGAHNQRGMVRISGYLRENLINNLQLKKLISTFEACSSVQLHPLLKRSDEKYVTEKGYDQAKFVEDVARDLVLAARNTEVFESFAVEVENEESIHTHNAFARINEEKKS
ncbi:GTP cyclohydrolase FolE2 [Spirochaeta dissipatitropha]